LKKIKLLSNPSYHQAEVWLVEENGQKLVYKDFSKWGILGAFIIKREAWFYKKLSRIEGFPKFFGTPTPYSLLIEYIDGIPSKKAKNLPEEFFERLKNLISRMHKKNIYHFDLRHLSNILVKDGNPYIIDLGTCLYIPVFGFLFKWIDECAVLYIKGRISPELLSNKEKRILKKINRISKLWFFHKILKGD